VRRVPAPILALALALPAPQAAAEPFRILQIADPQFGQSSEGIPAEVARFDVAVELANTGKVDVALVLGDLTASYSAEQRAAYRDGLARLQVPVYEAPGNHDLGSRTCQNLTRYLNDYLGDGKARQDYYWVAVEGHGQRHAFVVLNTALIGGQEGPALDGTCEIQAPGRAAAMMAWLENVAMPGIAAGDFDGVWLTGHHPLWQFSMQDGNSQLTIHDLPAPANYRSRLDTVLRGYGIRWFLAGHRHVSVIKVAADQAYRIATPGGPCCATPMMDLYVFDVYPDGRLVRRVVNTGPLDSALDQDLDRVPDLVDDCLGLPNLTQRDSDGDGFGNACDADLDGDGAVNLADLALFRQAFFTSAEDADFDGNGLVNFADLATFRARFLAPPGPSALAY
jgi:hypothetical protein